MAESTTSNANPQTNGETSKLSIPISDINLDQLKKLPIETLDTIRSKLVQLIDAITTFRFQLETSALTPNSIPYPTLISKFLILLNHTEALSQALNTPVPPPPLNRFELPSVRAEREEKSKWEDGPSKRSLLGNLAVIPRGLEGLEDGKEWIVGVLTRTKLAPEIEKEENDLLSLLPPINTDHTSVSNTIPSLMEHIKKLTKSHENHILACRTALHKARYGKPEPTDLDSDDDDDDVGVELGDEKYEWKMRVEVDDLEMSKVSMNPNDLSHKPPAENPIIKGLLGFMRDGRSPTNQAVDGLSTSNI